MNLMDYHDAAEHGTGGVPRIESRQYGGVKA
jgi:hypothetical protein